MRAAALLVCFLLLTGCTPPAARQAPPPGDEAGLAEHEVVAARWLRRHAKGEVEFIRWGPHLSREDRAGKLEELLGRPLSDGERSRHVDRQPPLVVRVVFRATAPDSEAPATLDRLIAVDGAKVILPEPRSLGHPNEHGDGWAGRALGLAAAHARAAQADAPDVRPEPDKEEIERRRAREDAESRRRREEARRRRQ